MHLGYSKDTSPLLTSSSEAAAAGLDGACWEEDGSPAAQGAEEAPAAAGRGGRGGRHWRHGQRRPAATASAPADVSQPCCTCYVILLLPILRMQAMSPLLWGRLGAANMQDEMQDEIKGSAAWANAVPPPHARGQPRSLTTRKQRHVFCAALGAAGRRALLAAAAASLDPDCAGTTRRCAGLHLAGRGQPRCGCRCRAGRGAVGRCGAAACQDAAAATHSVRAKSRAGRQAGRLKGTAARCVQQCSPASDPCSPSGSRSSGRRRGGAGPGMGRERPSLRASAEGAAGCRESGQVLRHPGHSACRISPPMLAAPGNTHSGSSRGHSLQGSGA